MGDSATCVLPQMDGSDLFHLFTNYDVECSDSHPPDSRILERRYLDTNSFSGHSLLLQGFKPHATLDRSNDCRVLHSRSDSSESPWLLHSSRDFSLESSRDSTASAPLQCLCTQSATLLSFFNTYTLRK
jgi:hypothetical protein